MTFNRRLRPPAAAEYLSMSEDWLAKRRMKGEPPRYLKLGGRSIAYDLSDLDDFIAASRRRSTSEYPLPDTRGLRVIGSAAAADDRVPPENIRERAGQPPHPPPLENNGSHLGRGHRRSKKIGKIADPGAS
jgi:predicted DNA-binding transcriptional regulator AlpA